MSRVLLQIMRDFAESAPMAVAVQKEGFTLAQMSTSLAGDTDARNTAIHAFADVVKSICDFTAYFAMMTAAGYARYQSLCTRGVSDCPGDSLKNFKAGDRTLLKYLEEWAAIENDGILQFKLDTNFGPHTFVAERICDSGVRKFRIYQSYLKLYRLKDFLGLDPTSKFVYDSASKKAIDDFNKMATNLNRPLYEQIDAAYTSETDTLENVNERLEGSINDVTFSQFKTIRTKGYKAVQSLLVARQHVGHGRQLNETQLKTVCFQPLQASLAGGMDTVSYERLVGYTADRQVTADLICVIRCDEVERNTFKANSESFLNMKHSGAYVYPPDFAHR